MSFIKIKIAGIILGIIAGMFFLTSLVFAKEIPIKLQLDRELVEVGDILQLRLLINNMQNVPAPKLPEIDGFKSQYLGPSTKVSIINGRATSSITHRYRLVAMKTGLFTLGPFSFTHQGDNYTTNIKQIKVVARGQGAQQAKASLLEQSQGIAAGETLSGKIFLIIAAEKTGAFVNERFALTVKLYVNRLSVRDIKYPLLEGVGFIKEDFTSPRQYRENIGGVLYDIVEFKTCLYPTKAGQVTIGPARIKCNIVSHERRKQGTRALDRFLDDSFFSGFFGRLYVYPREITSAEFLLDVKDLPQEGKPEQFSGAVGDFKMKVKASPLKLNAGDPITLNMEISGKGNFDSVQSPVLSKKENFKVYTPQAKEEGGMKRFEQVIIPQKESIREIPEIVFVFFNPKTKEYVSLRQPSIAIEVSASEDAGLKMVEGPSAAQVAAPTHVLGTDIIYIKEDIGKILAKEKHFYNNRGFLMLQLLPLMLFGAAVIFQRRRERLSTDISYARKLRAPKIAREKIKKAKEYLTQAKTAEFYDQIFKTLQEYIGHRFNRPSKGITAEVVEELILNKGLNTEAASKLKRCFAECDTARYAPAQLDTAAMEQTLGVLEEVIDYLERNKQ